MPHFTIEKLDREQLREAWPIVRMSGLEVNFDWWISDATEFLERGGGVLAARASDGSIHGVAGYYPVHKLAVTLAVEMLITFELNGRAPARRKLFEALEQIAGGLECDDMALSVSIRGA